jgi:hypothetical protein
LIALTPRSASVTRRIASNYTPDPGHRPRATQHYVRAYSGLQFAVWYLGRVWIDKTLRISASLTSSATNNGGASAWTTLRIT